MSISEIEKFKKKMTLDGEPEVYSSVHIWYQVWQEYGDQLDKLNDFSPYVSVGMSRSSIHQAGSEATDIWGCKWIYPIESHDGLCEGHPIGSWSDLKDYQPPDPDKHTDWKKAEENFKKLKAEGRVCHGGTDHGFIFLRLTYLRGFQNMMMDMADHKPELDELISIVENYWFQVIKRWVDIGADVVGFGDDLGLQTSLPVSPTTWRRYIKPSYNRIFSYCRQNDVHVSLHSDGYILDIIPDLIECGVSQINPQDLVNGLDNLENLAKGKLYIHLDIDRQQLMVFGTPDEIDRHIHDCIKTLGSPKGGLSMIWYAFPPTKIENIEAGVKAMHEYADYWK
ncbi:hypothetical protein GF312_04630 [Candidatus Poribacteria bacterium]|nr:hypothetical protein [Candidatus Poribacteria bacterium]